jgi:hypothetical protein
MVQWFLWKKKALLLMAAGVMVVFFGIRHYQSPFTRLWLYGTRLALLPSTEAPPQYLVGLESHIDSWIERDDRLFAPLASAQLNEAGSLAVKPGPIWTIPRSIRIQVKEWTRYRLRADEAESKTIPPGHPSIVPATVLIDGQGTVLELQSLDRLRIGRVITFLFPRFPKGTHRLGSSWSEDVDWMESLGDWKIILRGTAHWQVRGYETCSEGSCVRLVYRVEMSPAVLQMPEWARGKVKPAQGQITGTGEVLYDLEQKSLVANTLTYKGDISLPLDRLEQIPWEDRVGNTALEGPGDLVLRLSNRWDVRNP